ncbi:DUF4007 family protein [uncultured Treponema sp.]|uniref:DUF4007 family protein n=1 Tax=uncultured Treponema sp. TaxID=162155 RepID=UPI002601EF6D|nr:DUF4007 family protein [uncultured Treponema sp.]
MKYRGHETFSIRKNWLAKGMEAVHENPGIFTDKTLEPMDELGIGRNMVVSLRYWLKAVGLTKEEKSKESRKTETVFTPLGKIVYGNDQFVEEAGTLWLLQNELATNRENATSWYFFFNEFNLTEFTKDDFVTELLKFDKGKGGTTALSSFDSDFECIVNTYVSRFKNAAEIDPEDNIESPFAELGLLDSIGSGKKLYRKVIPPKQNIPPLIFLASLYRMCEKNEDGGAKLEYKNFEIPLSDIQNRKNSAGKVFNLDVITLMDILSELETLNLLKVVRTSGLDVVRLLPWKNFEKDSGEKSAYESCIEKYYGELKK